MPFSAGRKTRYPIASVDNALRLLVLLAEGRALRLTDAANELGIAPSTAHRLLAMLEAYGFARRHATRAYVAGAALATATSAATRERTLAEQAQPVLDALGRTYDETIFVAVLDDDGARFIAGRESRLALRVGGLIHQTFPAHATASGKVLLAALTRRQLRARYPDETLPLLQSRTIATRAALEAELDIVRTRGHAISLESNAPGVSAIAVPVRVGDGVAALTLVAPSIRFDVRALESTLPALRRAAQRIARDAQPALPYASRARSGET